MHLLTPDCHVVCEIVSRTLAGMQGVSVHRRDNKPHADVCLHVNDPDGWPIVGLLVTLSVRQSIHRIEIIELQCSHKEYYGSRSCVSSVISL